MSEILFTIGHSNHPFEVFLALLAQHQISAVADVRSSPHSRYCPHFDRSVLQDALPQAGITYVFLGKELGARSDLPSCYVNGRVSYERLAQRPEFQGGLNRVRQGAGKYRLALLCAEKDPLDCHRAILVCRHLRSAALSIQHILSDGKLEAHTETEARLRDKFNLQANLFESEADVTEQAYDRQAGRISFQQVEAEAENE